MVENGSGDPQLIIEQTSSSENHYELMALAGAVTEVRDEVHSMRALLEQSFTASETMRQEAQRILALHEQSAGEYLRTLDDDVDPHPFQSVPAGTTIRDLPDGGRLFSLSDGSFLRVLPDGGMVAIGEDGEPVPLDPASAGIVTLPGGLELTLVADAITTTQETAGIEGLPHDVDPVLASVGRYTVTLPDGIRLDVSHAERIASVINPTGTIVVLGIGHIEGVGEDVQVRSISGGSKSFRAMESRHAGMIEANGTIHLSLSSGLDLVIHFPEDNGSGVGDDDHSPICFDCEEHD